MFRVCFISSSSASNVSVFGIFFTFARSTEGGGLKLFGQCPYRTNTFQKGASPRREDFNSFATPWQIRWSRGRIYVTSYKWLRWSKALQGCPKPPPHSSDALPLTSGWLSIFSFVFILCFLCIFSPTSLSLITALPFFRQICMYIFGIVHKAIFPIIVPFSG